MLEHLLLPCIVTVAAIALSAILFRGFLQKRAGQTAVEGSADNDSATQNGTVETAAHTCTTPQVEETATSSGYDYEVFLSFRGPDTRSGFTDFLYTSLKDAGIRTFRDDDELHVGEEFASELLQKIKQSKILIPIFSKGYASSVWCLKELVQMVKCQKNKRQKIMPIFYDVTPSEVRRQTGSFENAFVLHERKRRYDEKTIAEWKDALTAVADIKGWDLQSMPNRQEGQFAKTITQKVFNELKTAYLEVSNCLVNVDNHVDAIMELIGPLTSGTRIIGIYGMGGIGKTTTAKIIYNQLVEKFDCCCFMSDIREKSERKGIESLQNQLISDILKNKCTDIRNIDDGIKIIKERFPTKRVLLLLDDVHEKKNMDALVGECDWFGEGSKLIITTRNKEVLDVLGVESCYELWGMDHNQSLQLFSKHAFKRDHPLDEYIKQSERAIKIAGGLPLALEIMGSLLAGIDKKKWDSKLAKWEGDPHKDVRSKLKISYDELEDKEKQIFLDIACLLIGYDKDIMVHFWISEFHPEDAIDVLENMSLIKIREDNKVWMHDQLRDLGRHIVCQETNINKQIRVWDREKALDLLQSHEMKKKVEALRLHLDHQHSFTYEDFKSLPNLRFLEVDDPKEIFCAEKMLLQHKGPSNVLSTNVFRKNSNLLPRLRWLSWHNIRPTFEITNFSVENLTILDLSRSEITHDWKGWSHMKVIKNLKVLNLAHCRRLKRIPNFSAHSNLERLILSCCKSLIEIDGSICQLKRLVFLDVSYCRNLQRLPEMVGNLDSLTKLYISHTSIEEIPDSIGMLKNLKVMKMQNDVPNRMRNDAYQKLGKVKRMEIADRYNHVTHVHTRSGSRIYGDLRMDILGWPGVHTPPRFPESLVELELEELRVDTFPDLSNLADLTVLHLGFGPPNCDGKSYGLLEKQISWGIGNLCKLESLLLCFFRGTASSTDLSLPLYGCDSLCSMDLSNLRKLSSLNICCSAIAKIEGLGCLESLRDLKLEEVRLAVLPDLSKLNKLRRIQVSCCGNLVEIQGELPQSLETLNIDNCKSLHKLPELPSLKRLQKVTIRCLNIQILDLSNLDGITELSVIHFHNLVEIQGELPQSLKVLYMDSCESLSKLPKLSSMKRPQDVAIYECGKLDSLQELPNLFSLMGELYIEVYSGNRMFGYEGHRLLLQGFEHLQIVDISNWDGIKHLSVIDCHNLVEIQGSNLGGITGLVVMHCHNLVEIQGKLPQSLITLYIENCESLLKLPELSSLKRLQEVSIRGNEKLDLLQELPNLFSLMGATNVYVAIGNQKLKYEIGVWLMLCGFEHMQIPDLSNWDEITHLSVRGCHNLVEIIGSNLDGITDLSVRDCHNVVEILGSNLDGITNLSVRDCHNLVEIQGSNLDGITNLSVRDCHNLVEIQGSNLGGITDLSVRDCHNLVEIQGELPQSLEILYIDRCESLLKLPELSSLKRLQKVTIRRCGKLDSLQELPNLIRLMAKTDVYVDIGNQTFEYIRGHELLLWGFEHMQILDLSNWDRIRDLSVGGCHNLVETQGSNLDGITHLSVRDCHNLVEIQGELPQSLKTLSIESCESLQKLPELSSLKRLQQVTIRRWNIQMQIPDLSNLDGITDLLVVDCHNLVEIQGELPQSLETLYVDIYESLQKLPELSSLKRLREVKIRGHGKLDLLQELPNLFSLMGKTDYVDIRNQTFGYKGGHRLLLCGFEQMQIPNLSNLDGITDLSVIDCHNLVEIQGELPQSLETLYIDSCESLQKLPELSSLERLREVIIRGCGKLDVEKISQLCLEKSIEFVGEDEEDKFVEKTMKKTFFWKNNRTKCMLHLKAF